ELTKAINFCRDPPEQIYRASARLTLFLRKPYGLANPLAGVARGTGGKYFAHDHSKSLKLHRTLFHTTKLLRLPPEIPGRIWAVTLNLLEAVLNEQIPVCPYVCQ